MSEFQLVRHCSPTLAGFKVGNIVNCSFSSIEQLYEDISHLNSQLNGKGIYAVLLRVSGSMALIYVYRPHKLLTSLKDPRVTAFLSKCGYKKFTIGALINALRRRLVASRKDDFPHEIGIFLGYPFEDIIGFLDNKGKNSLLTGTWKVYSDVCTARCTFAKHKKCTKLYCERLSAGTPISRLAVNIY
ncbi:Protein of unknown function [Peptostreptococcaceae bacterium pGA-8]|nr:Protein of unknown function [Peptostreptococcaceae bacterium pGA-8]